MNNLFSNLKTFISNSITSVAGVATKFKTYFNLTSVSNLISLLFQQIQNYFTLYRIKLLIILFSILYSLFMIIAIYFIYKSYQYAAQNLNNFIYYSMSKDISKLNLFHPIQFYSDSIPSLNHIKYIYGKLGIIDYNDYIYSNSPDTRTLKDILNQNYTLHQQTNSIVFANIINQHSQLFGDLAVEFLKRMIKVSLPLVASLLILGGIMLLEPVSIL
jgi:hypothetical protein